MADRTIYLYDDIDYSNEYKLNNGVNIDLVGKKHIKKIKKVLNSVSLNLQIFKVKFVN